MASYLLRFYRPQDGVSLAVIDNQDIAELEYTRKANDISDITVTLRADESVNRVYRKKDAVCHLERQMADRTWRIEGVFLMRYFNRFWDEEEQTTYIVMTGYSLEHLLKRRMIVNEDDPVSAGGFLTRIGPAANVMYNLVYYQCVAPVLNLGRAFPNFTASTSVGLGNTTFVRVLTAQTNLYTQLRELSAKGEVDFRVVATDDIQFECQIGSFGKELSAGQHPTGHSVVFSDARGNVIDIEQIVDTSDEITFVYAFGQGPKEDREVIPLASNTVTETPFNRIEGKTDARFDDTTALEGLYLAAVFHLRENAERVAITFEIPPDIIQSEYRIEWDLYDIVSVEYNDTVFDYRVIAIKVNVTPDRERISVVTAPNDVAIGNPDIANITPVQEDLEFVRALNFVKATLNKHGTILAAIEEYTARAEYAGAAEKSAYADLPSGHVGQMFWVTDGRKPGETAGNGTGVPAHFDGTDWISDYDALAVVI